MRTFRHLKIIEFFIVSIFVKFAPFCQFVSIRAFVFCWDIYDLRLILLSICLHLNINWYFLQSHNRYIFLLTISRPWFVLGYFLQPHLPAAAGRMSAGPISSYQGGVWQPKRAEDLILLFGQTHFVIWKNTFKNLGKCYLAVPRQLYRWPCHSLTDY